eukprot:CAMPEP_0182425750 /NCGR_PEP_ID=MMETSP1167-20130531/12237_1 /TAXON_ID=2988 /ORGANISM="Mallomonas Sp, Strain CCMP3275" /LENGTH=469 /DNA_ID=CAMNT_0024606717 /DNA_START=293 /DNA_END=1702 /DNA_ORIENTATION=+
MTGDNEEINAASVILPLIKKHHLVLVTLLLYNALAMEALPIFLGAIVPNWVSVLMSVTLVLIFGEIIPSAVFTGPDQLFLAAKFVPFVKFLVMILYPVAYPISILLDQLFGHEEGDAILTRSELHALMRLQKPNKQSDYHALEDSEHENDLSLKEVGILSGVLQLPQFCIRDVMIRMNDVYCLSADTLLDESALQGILSCGFSRIPVFNRKDKQNILGYMLVKSLVVVNPDDRVSLRSIQLREPLMVSPELGLLELLRQFQVARCHLALVSEQPEVTEECMRKGVRPPHEARVVGMVTLEDVLEKIIQDDIIDETDRLDSEEKEEQRRLSRGLVRPDTSMLDSTDGLIRRKHVMAGSKTCTIRFAKPNYDVSLGADWDQVLRWKTTDDQDLEGNRGRKEPIVNTFRRTNSVGSRIVSSNNHRRSRSIDYISSLVRSSGNIHRHGDSEKNIISPSSATSRNYLSIQQSDP